MLMTPLHSPRVGVMLRTPLSSPRFYTALWNRAACYTIILFSVHRSDLANLYDRRLRIGSYLSHRRGWKDGRVQVVVN